jgi:hypothetical protein
LGAYQTIVAQAGAMAACLFFCPTNSWGITHGDKSVKSRDELESNGREAIVEIQNRPKRVVLYFKRRNMSRNYPIELLS